MPQTLVRPHVLVSVGLLGIVGYTLAQRLWNPAFLANDLLHGVWLGACLGLEILGLVRMSREKRDGRSA